MSKICLWCKKRRSWDSVLGLYCEASNCCKVCNRENGVLAGEWSRHAKAEIQANEKDVLQPLDKKGNLNKHFTEVYGKKIKR